jgi:hypothetical protein
MNLRCSAHAMDLTSPRDLESAYLGPGVNYTPITRIYPGESERGQRPSRDREKEVV